MIQPFVSFLSAIEKANKLSVPGHGQWLFYPGMLFGSRAKWWDDFGTRATCHEGIDIRFFRTAAGRVTPLDAGSKIPAWDTGTVLNICPDFLGGSVVVEHARNGNMRTISVMAHIIPEDTIAIGDGLKKDKIVGAVADTSHSKLAPHLHLSVMDVPLDIPPDRLTWDLFTDANKVNLINPVFI